MKDAMQTIKSTAAPIQLSSLQDAAQNMQSSPYWILLYGHDKLRLIQSKDATAMEAALQTDLSDLKEARLFNAQQEIYCWKVEGKWFARMRTDDEGETEINILEEDRHLADVSRFMDPVPTKKPQTVKVRNYYEYDENGLIKFIDARLVNIA